MQMQLSLASNKSNSRSIKSEIIKKSVSNVSNDNQTESVAIAMAAANNMFVILIFHIVKQKRFNKYKISVLDQLELTMTELNKKYAKIQESNIPLSLIRNNSNNENIATIKYCITNWFWCCFCYCWFFCFVSFRFV